MRVRALTLISVLLAGCAAAPPPPDAKPPEPTVVTPPPVPPPPARDPRVVSCLVSVPVGELDELPRALSGGDRRAKTAAPAGPVATPPAAGAPMPRPIQVPIVPPQPPQPTRPPPPPPPPPSTPTFQLVPQDPRLSYGPVPTSVTRGLTDAAGAEVCASLANGADVGQYTLELAMSGAGTPTEVKISDNAATPSPYLHCVMQRACQVTASQDAFGKQLFLPFQIVQQAPPPPPPPPPALALVDVTTVRSGGNAEDKVSTGVRALLTTAAQQCSTGADIPPAASVVVTLKLTLDGPRASNEEENRSDVFGVVVARRVMKPRPPIFPIPIRPPPMTVLRVGGVTTQSPKGASPQLVSCLVNAVAGRSIVVGPGEAKARTESVKVTWPDGSPR